MVYNKLVEATAELQYKNARFRMRELFNRYIDYEHANVFFFFFEVKTGQIVFVNKSFLVYMEIKFTDILGTRISDWLHKDDIGPSMSAWKAAESSDEAMKSNFGFCNRYITPVGETRYLRWGTSMVLRGDEGLDEDGDVFWFVTAMPSNEHEYEIAKIRFHEHFKTNGNSSAVDDALRVQHHKTDKEKSKGREEA
jgi:PAS domain-containing protein